ncbi:pyruvate dehydrogenase [Lactarius indigo]|nr:pyruvate dehydrogenase [Lactarius indigo]
MAAPSIASTARAAKRLSPSAVPEPPPAGGHLPSIATSKILRTTREAALRTPGIKWLDEDGNSPLQNTIGGRETRKMNLYQAVRDAMGIALAKDDTAIVFGEDVAFGGGLAEEFGIAGFGIGVASMGQTAIAEIQFLRLYLPCLRPTAKFRYRSGGQFNVGRLTVRTPSMSVGHGGLYHSQSPEGFFMGASGLKIVVPPSIRDPNPVIFMEPKILYRSAVEQVPIDDFELPLGRAEVLWGTPLYHCETALSLLAEPPAALAPLVPEAMRGARIELIDLRTVLPWDVETVVESVQRTGRLVIVHEASRTAGVGAEIAAEVQSKAFLKLLAPVRRVTAWDTPVGLQFEKFIIPDAIHVLDAVMETLAF